MIDVAASVAYRVVVPHGSAPASATLSENFVAAHWNAKAKRSEVGAISLHEGLIERFGLSPSGSRAVGRPIVVDGAAPVAYNGPLRREAGAYYIFHKNTTRRLLKTRFAGHGAGALAALDRRALDPGGPCSRTTRRRLKGKGGTRAAGGPGALSALRAAHPKADGLAHADDC